MSIPDLTRSGSNFQTYIAPRIVFMGRSITVLATLTTVACTIALVAAAVLKSAILAVSASIPLCFLAVAYVIVREEQKRYESITLGGERQIIVQYPIHRVPTPAMPLPVHPNAYPDPNFDAIPKSSASLPGVEQLRQTLQAAPAESNANIGGISSDALPLPDIQETTTAADAAKPPEPPPTPMKPKGWFRR
jgi:hypothetical protein